MSPSISFDSIFCCFMLSAYSLLGQGWKQTSVGLTADPKQAYTEAIFEYEHEVEGASPSFARLPEGVILSKESENARESCSLYRFKIPTGAKAGERTIVLPYSSPEGSGKVLQVRLIVPELAEVEPRRLVWRANELQTPKTSTIISVTTAGYEYRTVTPSSPHFEATLVQEAPQIYKIVVTPVGATPKGRSMILVSGENAEGIKTGFNLYVETL